MHVVQLKLDTTKADKDETCRRFYALSHIHNVLVKHARHLFHQLDINKEYQTFRQEYVVLLKKNKLSSEDKKRKKELAVQMNEIRKSIGLSEYSFQSYIKVCAKQFSKMLSSQQVQKEATRVWKGVEKVLFSAGKDIHYKKYIDFDTIGGKSNKNGVRFYKDTMSIEWLGLEIKCKLPKKDSSYDYIMESLSNNISYCELKRMMFPNGWHYYVLVYVKGDAPKKEIHGNKADMEYRTAGVDLGVSTVAAVSENQVVLDELAPDCMKYNKKIMKLQKKMDKSKRISNPDNYNSDGTVRKGKKTWKFTKSYFKMRQKLKSLYRQKSAYTKTSHGNLCNRLLQESVYFVTEEMHFNGLQKKSSQPAERQDKVSDMKQNDGTVKEVRKFKRKKRYGRSLNNRSPALFMELLKKKTESYGGMVVTVNMKKFKASQYNHQTGECIKKKLSDRWNELYDEDGNKIKIQRDLYSAFLLSNTDLKLTYPDKDKCSYSFDKFVKMHDEVIEEMKKNGVSMKQCFGF